jgi:MFS family permease
MGFSRKESVLVTTAAALVFSRVFGISVVMPGFVAYARALPGATDLLVGTAFGAYGLTLALMQLPMGWISDKIGRRPVLIFGTLLFVAGSAWAAMANDMTSLLAARLLQGMGAISSAAMAMVGETLPAERRTVGMALVGIPAGLGFFVGLLVAGAMPLNVGGLFWLSAGMGAIAGVPLLFMRETAQRITRPTAPLGPAVLTLASAGFVMNFSLTTVLFFLSDLGRTTGTQLVWPLLAGLVVMGLLSRQADRRGWTWQPIAAGLLVLAAGATGAIQIHSLWPLAVGVFFAAHASLAAIIPSQVSRLAGPSGGRGHGIQNVVAYGGTFVAGPIAGAFVARSSISLAVLATMAVLVASACLWRLRVESDATQTAPLGSEQG